MLLLEVFNTVFGQVEVDPGSTFENLRQNSAVVGLLYVIVVIQSGVIVKLWLKIDKLQDARVADLKERLEVEDKLEGKIEELKDLHYKKDK